MYDTIKFYQHVIIRKDYVQFESHDLITSYYNRFLSGGNRG